MKLADLCREGELCKPYEVGEDKLIQLGHEIASAYHETVAALEQAIESLDVGYSV